MVRDWSLPPPSRKNEYIISVWSPNTATTPEEWFTKFGFQCMTVLLYFDETQFVNVKAFLKAKLKSVKINQTPT